MCTNFSVLHNCIVLKNYCLLFFTSQNDRLHHRTQDCGKNFRLAKLKTDPKRSKQNLNSCGS